MWHSELREEIEEMFGNLIVPFNLESDRQNRFTANDSSDWTWMHTGTAKDVGIRTRRIGRDPEKAAVRTRRVGRDPVVKRRVEAAYRERNRARLLARKLEYRQQPEVRERERLRSALRAAAKKEARSAA